MTDDAAPKPPKQRRSRNGCNECRRLHRRCDELKPSCGACLADNKPCSYARPLTWISRPTRPRGTRRPRPEPGPAPSSSSSSPPSRSPSPSSSTALLAPRPTRLPPAHVSIPPSPIPWLPWLSPRHRLLVSHFAHVTCGLSVLDANSHRALCASLLPLALDSTLGFPLLAAMLGAALTHRRTLGVGIGAGAGGGGVVVDDAASVREAAYWEAVAVGHLSRLRVDDGDEDAGNVFAATALLLSQTEAFGGGERVGSWRRHLEGGMAVLRGRGARGEGGARRELRKLGVAMQKVASVFVCTGNDWGPRKGGGEGKKTGVEDEDEAGVCESVAHFETCDRLDFTLGVSHAFMHTLVDVQRVAADMTALLHMERVAGEEGMAPLWEALWRRVEMLVVATQGMCGNLVETDESMLRAMGLDAKALEEVAHLNRAYYYITLTQIHMYLMGHNATSQTVQQGLADAMDCLEKIELRDRACPGVALLQPCFAVGCYSRSNELRERVLNGLSEVKKIYGRGNAQKAKEFLWELWERQDADGDAQVSVVDKLDWRFVSRAPHRGEEYEWTDLMAEKGWDLSLW